jgi:hypothetical protein
MQSIERQVLSERKKHSTRKILGMLELGLFISGVLVLIWLINLSIETAKCGGNIKCLKSIPANPFAEFLPGEHHEPRKMGISI